MSRGAWREVVHIKDGVGPHGGKHWCLTLSCGHIIFHRKPKFRLGRDVAGVTRRTFEAPHKKRCILCPEDGDG